MVAPCGQPSAGTKCESHLLGQSHTPVEIRKTSPGGQLCTWDSPLVQTTYLDEQPNEYAPSANFEQSIASTNK